MKASTIKELEDFVEEHRGWLFRGHRNHSWKLETSLERISRRCKVDQIEYEKNIFYEFRRHAHAYIPRVPKEDDTLEWLALMQHYGAPTRLLDFTYSFWIALFFAFEEADRDCAVIALNPKSLAPNDPIKDYNLIIRMNIEEGWHIDDFLYFNVPFYTNDRLEIQKGTFVFSLNLKKSFNDLVIKNDKEFKKLIIDKSLFSNIRIKLNDFNCNSRILFSGIDGYARYFKNYTK